MFKGSGERISGAFRRSYLSFSVVWTGREQGGGYEMRLGRKVDWIMDGSSLRDLTWGEYAVLIRLVD